MSRTDSKKKMIDALVERMFNEEYEDVRPKDESFTECPKMSAKLARNLRQIGGFPSSSDMATRLRTLGESQAGHLWKHSLSGFYGDGYDLESLRDFLGSHPEELLKDFLWKLCSHYYPETILVFLDSYFLKGHPKTGYNEDELIIFFANLDFITSNKERALELDRLMKIGPVVTSIREEYWQTAAKHEFEAQAIERLLIDIRARKNGVKPNWRDYLAPV